MLKITAWSFTWGDLFFDYLLCRILVVESCCHIGCGHSKCWNCVSCIRNLGSRSIHLFGWIVPSYDRNSRSLKARLYFSFLWVLTSLLPPDTFLAGHDHVQSSQLERRPEYLGSSASCHRLVFIWVGGRVLCYRCHRCVHVWGCHRGRWRRRDRDGLLHWLSPGLSRSNIRSVCPGNDFSGRRSVLLFHLCIRILVQLLVQLFCGLREILYPSWKQPDFTWQIICFPVSHGYCAPLGTDHGIQSLQCNLRRWEFSSVFLRGVSDVGKLLQKSIDGNSVYFAHSLSAVDGIHDRSMMGVSACACNHLGNSVYLTSFASEGRKHTQLWVLRYFQRGWFVGFVLWRVTSETSFVNWVQSVRLKMC